MSWYPKRIRTIAVYVSSADLPSDSLRENLWAVTRRTMKNYKTVKIGGCGYECLPVTIQHFTTLYLTLLHSTTCSTWLREFQYNTESRCTTTGTAVYCLAIRDMSNHRIRWFIIFRMVYSKPLSVHRVR